MLKRQTPPLPFALPIHRKHLLFSVVTPLYLLYKVQTKPKQSANKVLREALCKDFIQTFNGFCRILTEEMQRYNTGFLYGTEIGKLKALKMCSFRFSTQHFTPFQLFDFPTVSTFSYLSSKKKNPPLLYSYVTYLYLINNTYSP